MSNFYELDQARVTEYEQQYKDAVQPRLSEEVQAVGSFQRTGRYLLTVPIVGQVAKAFYLLYELFAKPRAGSLPMHFLIAVTATKVHAFKYRPRAGGKPRVKHEVAAWDRADVVVVGTADGALSSTVTLNVSEAGRAQVIVCNTGKLSMNPWSAGVLELLGHVVADGGD